MGIQQIINSYGKAADPQKVLSTTRKKTSDEDVQKVEENSSKDKIDLSEDGLKVDQMIKELERTTAGIKDDPQNAVKAQANVSSFGALEVLDDSLDSVYSQLDQVKQDINDNTDVALETQNNLVRKSVLDTVAS